MTDNADYEEVLSQNVSDAKKDIRDMEDPDYSELLKIENDNKDRKTIKEFLQKKADTEEVEVDEKGVDDPEEDDSADETEESEDLVEEIEEQTAPGLLGGYTRQSVLAGGLVFGILLGLVVGMGFSSMSSGNPQVAEDTVSELLTASGFEGDMEFTEATEKNGMYYVSVNMTATGANQTQESSRSFYVSKDGELLFPEVQSPFITSPIVVDDALQQLQQRQQRTQAQGTTGQTGNTTQ